MKFALTVVLEGRGGAGKSFIAQLLSEHTRDKALAGASRAEFTAALREAGKSKGRRHENMTSPQQNALTITTRNRCR